MSDETSTSVIINHESGPLPTMAQLSYRHNNPRSLRAAVRLPTAADVAKASQCYTEYALSGVEEAETAQLACDAFAEVIASATMNKTRRSRKGCTDVGDFESQRKSGSRGKRVRKDEESYNRRELRAILLEMSTFNVSYADSRKRRFQWETAMFTEIEQRLRARESDLSVNWHSVFSIAFIALSNAWAVSLRGHPSSQRPRGPEICDPLERVKWTVEERLQYVGISQFGAWLFSTSACRNGPCPFNAEEKVPYESKLGREGCPLDCLVDDIARGFIGASIAPSTEYLSNLLQSSRYTDESPITSTDLETIHWRFRDTATRIVHALTPAFAQTTPRGDPTLDKRVFQLAFAQGILTVSTANRFACVAESLLAYFATLPDQHIGVLRERVQPYYDRSNPSNQPEERVQELFDTYINNLTPIIDLIEDLPGKDRTAHLDRVHQSCKRCKGKLEKTYENHGIERSSDHRLLPVNSRAYTHTTALLFASMQTQSGAIALTDAQIPHEPAAVYDKIESAGLQFRQILEDCKIARSESSIYQDRTRGAKEGHGVAQSKAYQWLTKGHPWGQIPTFSAFSPPMPSQPARRGRPPVLQGSSFSEFREQSLPILTRAWVESLHRLEAAHTAGVNPNLDTVLETPSPQACIAHLVHYATVLSTSQVYGTPMDLMAMPHDVVME